MYVIAGLGNPGAKYENTRHNIGFMAVDAIAAKNHISVQEKKHKALLGKGMLGSEKVLLVKPQTFMNLSGESIREIIDYYKIEEKTELIVISDDISLAPGALRIRKKGSAGGHNGLKNIIAHLGTDQFPRVRVGVGAPAHPDHEMIDWVIGAFTAQEKKAVEEAVDRAVDAALCVMERGVQEAQNRYN